MKKFIITEEEKNGILKMYNTKMIMEQYNQDMLPSQESKNNKMESKMESYKIKMEKFLDELKSSGQKIDGQRFLTQVRNETDKIFWNFFYDENSSAESESSFSKLQLDLLNYFRKKIKS